MSDDVLASTYMLRDFLFARVYESDKIIREFRKAKKILRDLYAYYLEHPDGAHGAGTRDENVKNPEIDIFRHHMVCDFIAGMTDRFALMTYEKLFLPQQWTVL